MACEVRGMQLLLERKCIDAASRAVAYPGGSCDGKVMWILLGEVYMADWSELHTASGYFRR